ncbi:hypothetical protein K788_0001065 [Paraburkholderia caribensis MBA4]|uniref:Uncharacterized protein n=1 Tax=Paraburkholderia caribensis MBA4 TaxID=1323664 RepID=A0A0P0RGX7_9BURK|nr:hypothetical protein K788_0001065 [Paraburkholderia caribensis MBA4]
MIRACWPYWLSALSSGPAAMSKDLRGAAWAVSVASAAEVAEVAEVAAAAGDAMPAKIVAVAIPMMCRP